MWQSILSQRIDFHAAELEQVSAAARDLLKGLLERDPDARLTPKQALEHPWIKARILVLSYPVLPTRCIPSLQPQVPRQHCGGWQG